MRELVRDVSPSDEGTKADRGETRRCAGSASSGKEDSMLSMECFFLSLCLSLLLWGHRYVCVCMRVQKRDSLVMSSHPEAVQSNP